ncbi:hypothetical protein P280DRAFT_297839 [Massarina eburnea CBS 473.64]|uniref:Uncharacterized protein n=1 Tax=Massarina eburnea CBS 473.64 TaxID=1395130 RepID=A0A6A6RGX7_9PLEO|nr:hypothetical protein P280DRAFT_297839 [Massarina eburnea CBS 473.64]
MSITAEEWEDLQRDCHPFPSYIDAINGYPTPLELHSRNLARQAYERQQAHLAHQAVLMEEQRRYNTRSSTLPQAPNPNSSSRQYLRGLQDNPQPEQVHILHPRELLTPEYVWMPDFERQKLNENLTRAYFFLGQYQDNNRPGLFQQMSVMVQNISRHVSAKHILYLHTETMKRNAEAIMPAIWSELENQRMFPDGHPAKEARARYLFSMVRSLGPVGNAHAKELVRQMDREDKEGRDPYVWLQAFVQRGSAGTVADQQLGEDAGGMVEGLAVGVDGDAEYGGEMHGLPIDESPGMMMPAVDGYGMLPPKQELAGMQPPGLWNHAAMAVQHGSDEMVPEQEIGFGMPVSGQGIEEQYPVF